MRYFSAIAPECNEAPRKDALVDSRSMARKRITIRPPGLKPTTKVGTLGPYRGRLGFAWVIAPVVVGVVILIAGYFALFR
jgi:hypothetical protein